MSIVSWCRVHCHSEPQELHKYHQQIPKYLRRMLPTKETDGWKRTFLPGQLELRFLMASHRIGRGLERSHKATVSCCRRAALDSETVGWKVTSRAGSHIEDSKVQLNTWSTNHDLFNAINAWNHIRTRNFSMVSKKSNTLREENTGMICAGSPSEENQFITAETAASRNHLNLLNGFGLAAEWFGSATWKRPHSTLTLTGSLSPQ